MYTLKFTTEHKETGAYPQIEIDFKKVKKNNQFDYRKLTTKQLVGESLDLNVFEFSNGAKITDIVSSNRFNVDTGLFVNLKVKEILEKFQLNNSSFYPLDIKHSQQQKKYFLWHVVADEPIIDFEKSTYAEWKTKEIRIPVSSYAEIISIRKESSTIIRPQKVFLNRPVDALRLPMNIYVYISQELKGALEENNITGMEIEPAKVQFQVKK